jgi:hypothetical protein
MFGVRNIKLDVKNNPLQRTQRKAKAAKKANALKGMTQAQAARI